MYLQADKPLFPLIHNPIGLMSPNDMSEAVRREATGKTAYLTTSRPEPLLPGKRSGVLTRPTVDDPVAVITALWRSPASMQYLTTRHQPLTEVTSSRKRYSVFTPRRAALPATYLKALCISAGDGSMSKSRYATESGGSATAL